VCRSSGLAHTGRRTTHFTLQEITTTSVGAAAEIKQKLDLVDFIGESVPLKKAGTTFKGLCPFHGEKTPSFVVTPARESWHCFGCGKGGDIFSFVMERDGLDFPTALRQLAGRAGVEISERTSREDAHRKRLGAALEAAIAFYHQVLTTHAAGRPALEYLHGRGFTDQTLETFQIGFAPDSWDALTRALTTKRDFVEDDLEAAGLVSRRQRASGPNRRGVYDRFRGRIIFPIRDAHGNATGLGGRVVGAATDSAKYINTSATLLFDKSRTLYLIDRAKSAIKKANRAVLVEGNTDALMAHQAGFENVVGSLGTALTAGHIELVTRYASRLVLAYDVDAAGQSAATFGLRELTALVGEIERDPLHKGRLVDVRVAVLPEGRDPDEVIRDTPDAWAEAVEKATEIVEFLIDRAARRNDIKTIPGRQALVTAVIPTLRLVSNPTRLDGYLQLLARRSGVDERVLRETLQQRERPSALRGRDDAAQPGSRINLEAILATPDAIDPRAVERALDPAETPLLRLLLVRPELIDRVRDRLTPELLTTTPARELWRSLAAAQTSPSFDRAAFLAGLDATLEAVARTLYARADPIPVEADLQHAIDQNLLALERARLSEAIDFKRAQLSEAEAADDDALVEHLTRDVRDLQQRRLGLDRERATTTLLANRRISSTPTPTPAGGTA
jgi:DNA primase